VHADASATARTTKSTAPRRQNADASKNTRRPPSVADEQKKSVHAHTHTDFAKTRKTENLSANEPLANSLRRSRTVEGIKMQ
ncbi:hypothetical protein SCB29_40780, partial [Paraburkholderia sp. SIMBA_055]